MLSTSISICAPTHLCCHCLGRQPGITCVRQENTLPDHGRSCAASPANFRRMLGYSSALAAASWETWDLAAPAMFEGLRGVRDCATFLALVCNMLCVCASFNILDFGCKLACTLTCGTSRSQAHPGVYLALGLEAPTLQTSLLLGCLGKGLRDSWHQFGCTLECSASPTKCFTWTPHGQTDLALQLHPARHPSTSLVLSSWAPETSKVALATHVGTSIAS